MEDRGPEGWGLAGHGKEVALTLGEGLEGGKGEMRAVWLALFIETFG